MRVNYHSDQMKTLKKLGFMQMLLCLFMFVGIASADAQTYVRYVNERDLTTRAVYSGEVLTTINMPLNVSRLAEYPPINAAMYELSQVLRDPSVQVLQVWVCGTTSPDGLWADNVALCERRTNAAVNYVKSVMGYSNIPVHAENLYEDWDRLYELVQKSNIPYREEVLYIIKTKTWGERKAALQQLAGGRVWRLLMDDFFPQLRGVRFAIFCKWDPSKPYMTNPGSYSPCTQQPASPCAPAQQTGVYGQPQQTSPCSQQQYVQPNYPCYEQTYPCSDQTSPCPQPQQTYQYEYTPSYGEVYEPATVVRGSRYKDPYKGYNRYYKQPRRRAEKTQPLYKTPWMGAVKTDLLTDVLLLPQLGFEFQMSRHLSFELMGWYSTQNIIKQSPLTKIYGFRPELRYWIRDAMSKGIFIGVHSNLMWYTMLSTDSYIYQTYGQKPAWSVGATFGYSLPLDRKNHWALEFVAGLGYGNYKQNIFKTAESGELVLSDSQHKHYVGLTRVGINLAYRFSFRRYHSQF